MYIRLSYFALVILLLTPSVGCSKPAEKTISSLPSSAPTAPNGLNAAKDGAAEMLKELEQLSGQLEQKQDDEVKKTGGALETRWLSFEDEVKPAYPELYVRIETALSPLTAGAKQATIDYAALGKLDNDLKGALNELLTALTDNRGAVDASALAASAAMREAANAYNQYVQEQGTALVDRLASLHADIQSGDLKKAQESYVLSRLPYERIEPVIERFKELDAVMDARVDDFADENDPAFTGYHRIEHLLFVKQSVKEAEPFAAALVEDGRKMQQRIAKTTIEPADFVTGVGELMEEAQTTKITGEEERWSEATIPVIRANVEGAETIYNLVKTELQDKDSALDGKISASLKKVLDQLNAMSPEGSGWGAYSKLEQPAKVDLKNKLETLAESLVKMPGTLGK